MKTPIHYIRLARLLLLGALTILPTLVASAQPAASSPQLLFASSVQRHVSPKIYLRLKRIFPHLQHSQRYSAVYDHSGRILLATVTEHHKTLTAIRYTNSQGITGYYTPTGQALFPSVFLKAPLAYRRISNGFSLHRWHPILHITRPHYGIDYAAPTGTPIHAIAGGEVRFAGWGGGYGRAVVIRHNGEYQSLYAHMSHIGYIIKPGQWVKQGQIIGYVGSTGLATGPHLHFGLYEYGHPINPARILPKSNRPLQIAERDLPDFLAKANRLFTQVALANHTANNG